MGEWIAAAGAAIYGALSAAATSATAAVGGTAAAGTAAAAGGAAAAAPGAIVGSSMMGGLTAASATTAAATGAGMVGTGGMTAAGIGVGAGVGAGLGAVAGEVAKATLGGALSTGASMLAPKPEMPGAPPPVTPYGKDSLPKKIAEPSGPPTEGVASSNAFKAEERRRLLAGMPQATQNIFSSPGGDQSGARLRKPRLLGGGVGQTTTGV